MEEIRKKFGIELLPSLRQRLKRVALDRNQSLWQITQEAIEKYLAEPGGKEPEDDPDVEMLREFKQIAEPEDYAGLRQNLVVFLRDARRALAARKRKKA